MDIHSGDTRDLSSSVHSLGNNIILFLFIGLLIGQITKHVVNKIKVPYTPVLAILGIGIGLLEDWTKYWGDGAEAIAEIDPHTFFLLFLPPLIFESAFSIDWHVIKVEFFQILILAGPCLLMSAFLTAVTMKYVLRYDDELTFEAAVMFGALISATDPVAVVSVLKELGASRTLSTLIEGESLLNDGTAYVMFSVTLELVEGKSFDTGHIVGNFFRLSFGGPLLGVIFGVVISWWLRRIVNNSILETNITIITAYLCFYTAEMTRLEVSGILALVALGLFMTKEGRTRISSEIEETLHHIWSYLQFVAETLVFIIAGVIISMKVLKDHDVIGWEDYLKCLALYALLHVIRYLIIFIVGWPISKLGYGLTFKQGVVLGYAGLRGAVSLTLALIVYLDPDVDTETREIILFHTAGITVLTLIINGTTVGYVVRGLGLMRFSNVKKKMISNLIKAYDREVKEIIVMLKQENNFGKCEYDQLVEFACTHKIKHDMIKHRNLDTDQLKSSVHGTASEAASQEVEIDKNDYTDEELYIEAKYRYLTTLKGIYWDYFEQSKCSAKSVQLLIESADRALDHVADTVKDFKFIETYFQSSLLNKFLLKLRKVACCKWITKDILYDRVSFVYDVTVNYVEAHEECNQLIARIVYNEEILHKVKQEINKEFKRAEHKLNNELEENFGEITKAIQLKRGGFYLISRLKNFVEEMVNHGQMEEKEAKFFMHHLNNEVRKLKLNKMKISFEGADVDFEHHCELVKILNEEDVKSLYNHFSETQYDKGEFIIRKGQVIKDLYYISKGVVYERNGDKDDDDAPKIKTSSGDILGLQFITKDEGKSFTNCYTKTVCTVRVFPIAELRNRIRDENQEIKLWRYIGPCIIHLNPDTFTKLQQLDSMQLKGLLKESTYYRYDKGERFSLMNGGILFEGILEAVYDGEENFIDDSSIDSDSEKDIGRRRIKIKSYAFLYPDDCQYITRSEACVFEFPEDLKDKWISFNPKVFNEALNYLPSVANNHASRSIRQANNLTLSRKERTILQGLPKGLAHADPVGTFRGITIRGDNEQGSHTIRKIGGGLLTQNTILPKGYMRQNSTMMMKNAEPQPPPEAAIETKMTKLNKEEKKQKIMHKQSLDEAEEESSYSASIKDTFGNSPIKTKDIKAALIDSVESSKGNDGEGNDDSSSDPQDHSNNDEEEESESGVEQVDEEEEYSNSIAFDESSAQK